jgi:nucleoside-diphosphate-sugar epimerase
VNALILISAKRLSGTFEVGSGLSYTNRQVKEIVEGITGKKANIVQVPSMRSYDNENWVSTNLRIRSTGWLPKKTLEQSIAEMVEEFKKHD